MGVLSLATFIAFILGCVGTSKGNANAVEIAELHDQISHLEKQIHGMGGAMHTDMDCSYGDVLFGEEVHESDTGSAYQIVGASGADLTWQDAHRDAQSRCKDGHRGYLAIIGSKAENSMVLGLIAATPHATGEQVWIGATDTQNEGDFAWIGPKRAVTGITFWTGGADGQTVEGGFANWAKNEPNSGGLSGVDEDCVAMYGGAQDGSGALAGQWLDSNCYLGKPFFVVEFGPPPDSIKDEWAATHDSTLNDDYR